MKILILAAGKPALAYAKTGVQEYAKRLTRYAPVELRYVRDGSSADVSARLLEASEGHYRIALDERGERLTTEQLADRFRHWHMSAVKKIAFLIGASDGHTDELRHRADAILSLSSLTLQHELALLLLYEQIYRVHTLLKGEPYHR